MKKIAARFDCSLPMRGYIIGKLATDPAYGAVLERFGASNLPIVDIGCGLGLLAHYLRDRGIATAVVGHDFDSRKIDLARDAAARGGLSNITFHVGDAADHLPQRSNLVLLDVLHYLDAPTRNQLLQNLARRAREGCGILIRGAVRERSWRYNVTVAQEFWTRWSGWIPSRSPVGFPTIEEIVAPFEATGCRCEVHPLWGRTPFNSRLVLVSYSE